jgi:hypothetical protein
MGGVKPCLRKAATVEPTQPLRDVKLRSRIWARQVMAAHRRISTSAITALAPGFAII